MFDVLNELSFITININLFFDDNDIQFKKNEFKKNVINSINIKNNNNFIIV